MSTFGKNAIDQSEVQPCEEKEKTPESGPWHWIEIELVYEHQGEPVVGEEYLIKLPGGAQVRGFLDHQGYARVNFIQDPGSCEISFPNLDKESWGPA